jgi:transcriptional regulator with XRE-family HTH domain
VPEICDRLREAREVLGLSQQALAARCGITARSQRNYESGERLPDAGYLAAIAAAGADVLYILTGQHAGGVKPAPTLTAEEETMLGYFREASKEVRRAALGALLGASAGGATHHGGTHSQHSSGPGAVHIGSVVKAPSKRRG